MKNQLVVVMVTSIVAFALGYFVRASFESVSEDSIGNGKPLTSENNESPVAEVSETEAFGHAESGSQPADSHQEETVISSEGMSWRKSYVENRSNRLSDFFMANDVSQESAERIISGTIDADYYVSMKRQSMIDRHVAESAEPVTPGEKVRMTLTAEENEQLRAEQESLYRQIFGPHFEAYVEYERTFPQSQIVKSFSSNLEEPLEYAAKQNLVQILYEEFVTLESMPDHHSAANEADMSSTINANSWELERETYNQRLTSMRSYNERVLSRAQPYLTPSQFDQLKLRLEKDVRRIELLIEMTDIDESY